MTADTTRSGSAGGTLTALQALSGFILFLLLGAVGAAFGPVLPSYRATFDVTATIAGLLVSGHSAGAVIGILSPNVMPRRMQAPRRFSVAGLCVFALGCAVIGLSPDPPLAVVGAVIEGTGWGALVVCLNTVFADGFGSRSSAMLTLLNAVYGIGAIAGPAAVGLLFAAHFRPPFLTALVLSLAVMPLVLRLPDTHPATSGTAAEQPGRIHRGQTASVLARFVVLFFLLGGVEGGVGAWETTNLIAVGFSAATAATIMSLFWVAFTAGRLVAAPLSLRFSSRLILLAAIVSVVLLMVLTRVTGLAALTYSLAGLAIGPSFPMGLLWATQRLPGSSRAASFVIAADLFGAVLSIAALGGLVNVAGATALPLAFSVQEGCALLVCLTLLLSPRPD